MSENTINLIVSWAPFVVLIVVLVFFGWRNGMRARAPSGRPMIELYELQLEEMKRNVAAADRSAAALERIAQALEKR